MRRKQNVLRSISLATFRVELQSLTCTSFRSEKNGETAIPVQFRDVIIINTSVTIALCRFRKRSSPNALREKHHFRVPILFIFFSQALDANVCSKREFKKRTCESISQEPSNRVKIAVLVQFRCQNS